MSGQHTQGRLEAFTEPQFSGWWALRTDDGEIGSGDGGLFEPDARRLAACWNAFENVSTEMIEATVGTGSMQLACDSMLKLPQAQSELAAARALLQEVSDQIGAVTPFTIERGLGERIRSFLESK